MAKQKKIKLNLHSGRWSPNWVHPARWPFTGLLYLPRVIVRMEYSEKTCLGATLSTTNPTWSWPSKQSVCVLFLLFYASRIVARAANLPIRIPSDRSRITVYKIFVLLFWYRISSAVDRTSLNDMKSIKYMSVTNILHMLCDIITDFFLRQLFVDIVPNHSFIFTEGMFWF
jgi:hypothetical protein